MTVNPEGDVHVTDESKQGLGRHRFLTAFFGSFLAFVNPSKTALLSRPSPVPVESIEAGIPALDSRLSSLPWDPGDHSPEQQDSQSVLLQEKNIESERVRLLTDLMPDPGYFLAGGVAGVVSRTMTAPLDRLKVYLIAQTGVRAETVHAVKSGAPVQAAKHASRPLIEASKALWQMGGWRSLFAGEPSSASAGYTC